LEGLLNLELLGTFGILVGLEIVLGIDNILLISILSDRLPPEQRDLARRVGLGLALGLRCILLWGAAWVTQLKEPLIGPITGKSIILLLGGAFLLYKAVKEIHHVVEHREDHEQTAQAPATLGSVIAQIVVLDAVFSIDSVITAVGLTETLWVIYAAVLVSFGAVLAFAGPIASFVQTHPALKILALSFLVTIGISLMMEGLGAHPDKGYIYLPMGFALIVELLQMRFQANQSKDKPVSH
jgi:predicted tellurium resistance membrane protein TerC